MLPLDSLLCQCSGEEAHFKGHEEPLLPRHRPLDLELEGLRRRACIGDGHGQMLARGSIAQPKVKRMGSAVEVMANELWYLFWRPKLPS